MRRLYLLAAILVATTALAASTATFKFSTFEQLDKGEPHGTVVSSEGEVVAGRSAKRLKAKAAMVWSTTRAPGGKVYFGTGDKGRLLEVSGDKVRQVADLKTVLITALTMGPGGKVYAATMPGARVVEIDPRSGKHRERVKLPAEHIWDMVYDARTKRIFVASGAPGKIFTIQTRDWSWGTYFDPKEKHLLTIEPEPKGNWLVGSADKAIVYRVTNLNAAAALHDFDATELRDIARADDGTIYLAVNAFKEKTSGLPRVDRKGKGEGGTPIKVAKKKKSKDAAKPKVTASELRPGAKEGSGALFRLDKDSRLTRLLSLDKGYFTDIALDADGVLWAAEGTKGKVYQVLPNSRTVLTAFDLEERQVLALAVGGKTQYLGAGDAGAIYRVSAGAAAKPQYWSKVLDAKFLALWSGLRYQASGKLGVMSRSGNTAEPDRTWHNWIPAKAVGPGAARLTSQPARYLQVGFKWAGAPKTRLRSFEAYHRPQNQEPRVTAISIDRVVEAGKPRTPLLKVNWEVENTDSDPLVYRVYLRTEMGLAWQLISGHDPLTKAELAWDTEAVAEGYYRLKVVASDERGNGPGTTLRGERISQRILVDNRKPKISGLNLRFPYVTGMAVDGLSAIQRVEYRLDARRWRLLDPRDLVYDSPAEAFQFRLPSRLKGAHTVSIRATDSAGNTGAKQINLNIKR